MLCIFLHIANDNSGSCGTSAVVLGPLGVEAEGPHDGGEGGRRPYGEGARPFVSLPYGGEGARPFVSLPYGGEGARPYAREGHPFVSLPYAEEGGHPFVDHGAGGHPCPWMVEGAHPCVDHGAGGHPCPSVEGAHPCGGHGAGGHPPCEASAGAAVGAVAGVPPSRGAASSQDHRPASCVRRRVVEGGGADLGTDQSPIHSQHTQPLDTNWLLSA